MKMVEGLPRRTSAQGSGYDGLGMVVVDLKNDGSPVSIVSSAPAPQPGSPFHYGSMVHRIANEYDTRFSGN